MPEPVTSLELVPILSLPQAENVNVYDIVPIVQNGVTKRASAQQMPGAAGVANLNTDSSTTITMPLQQGKILAKFIIKSTANFDLSVTAGATTYLENEPIEAGVPRLFTVDVFDWFGPLNVVFTGLTGIVEIKIFLMG